MNDGIRLKSSIESLRGLIVDVREGRLRLPAFQRSFTWRNDQMADLFDSVARNYPIGSLFLWTTTDDHVTSDYIGPFKQPDRKPHSAISLVVDGQHRVVTLIGVLLADAGAEDRWKLYYDPRAERFSHAPAGRDPDRAWVPVASLQNTLGVLQESRRLLILDPVAAPEWVERIERVARAITEYQIPVIGYGGDLNSAVEVFARLNQKGKTMGADELLSALTYREARGQQFRLADEIDSVLSDIAATGFGVINRTFVLRAILAAADLDIYSRDWSRLAKDLRDSEVDPNRLKKAVADARRGLLAAIEFLRSEGILVVRQLSYGMQLVALSAYLAIRRDPDATDRALLAQMLWVSSFTAWFGPPAQERTLVRELRTLASTADESFGSLPQPLSIDLDTAALPMPSGIDQKSARVRAFLNVLIAQGPRRADGSLLGEEVGPLLLTREASALCRIFTGRGPKDLLASPANRVIAVTNEAGAARQWLRTIDPAHRDAVLRSLAIPPEAFDLLENNDVTGFLEARLRYLDELERAFMHTHRVTPPKPGAKPAPSPIDTDD